MTIFVIFKANQGIIWASTSIDQQFFDSAPTTPNVQQYGRSISFFDKERILIGATINSSGAVFLATVRSNLSVVETVFIQDPEPSFGASVTYLGPDQRCAGCSALAIGSPLFQMHGRVDLCIVTEQFTLLDRSSFIPQPNQTSSLFGESVLSIGDLNEDGTPDLAVGSPGYSTDSCINCGAVIIYFLDRTFTFALQEIVLSDTNLGITHRLDTDDQFGYRLSLDPYFRSLIISSPNDDTIRTDSGLLFRVFLAQTGSIQRVLTITPYSDFPVNLLYSFFFAQKSL